MKKIKMLIKVLVLSAILIGLFNVFNRFFQPVWYTWNNYYTVYGFYEEPKNTIETVFLGRSVVASGIIPTQLYDEYGICSYNLATEAQPMLASYYWLEEAYRLHSDTLKTAVLDVSGLRATSRDAFYHKALDGMKVSDVKYRAVKDYVGNDIRDILTFMTPLVSYHSRWSTIKGSEFDKYELSPVNGTRGYHYIDKIYQYTAKSAIRDKNITLYATETNVDDLVDESVAYFEKMVEFCKEKDIKLVLIKTPTLDWSSKLHDRIDELAKESELEFFDFNYTPLYDELKFVHSFDTSEGYHPNSYGAVKLTQWIGQYLVDECGATDVRGSEGYEHLDEQLELYNDTVGLMMKLEEMPSADKYIEQASKEDVVVFITVNNDAARKLSEVQRVCFESIGLEELANLEFRDSYIGIIENGKVTYETVKRYNSGKKGESISYSGDYGSEIKYEIKSGGYNNGRIASVMVNGEELAVNERGINVVVYNTSLQKVIDSVAFDTCMETERPYYALNVADKLLTETHAPFYDKECLEQKVLNNWIASKYSEQRIETSGKSMIDTLKAYSTHEDVAIYISVNNEVSENLSQEDRARLREYGFEMLPNIEFGESYAAIINDGKILQERKESGSTKVILEDKSVGTQITSAGSEAGSMCSILINGVECAKKTRGINVVIYDKKLNYVISSLCFDTYQTTL